MFKKMPYSTRKFIRLEKARIRRQFFDPKKQQELIAELYNKMSGIATKEAGAIKETKEVKTAAKTKEVKNKK